MVVWQTKRPHATFSTEEGLLFKMKSFKYYKPDTLKKALDFLSENEKAVKVIAGGTDLMVKLRNNRIAPDVVIDVSEIESLTSIHRKDGFITIGAAVKLTEIAENDMVKKFCPILAQAAASVGAVQIRNRGTIGGNVCNASPSADTVPALVALGAVATIVGAEQERKVPLEDLYTGPGKTVIAPDELLTSLSIPEPAENTAGVFFKLGKRKAQAISIVNGAVQIGVNVTEHRFTDVKIALGAVAPTVLRIKEAEECLLDKSISEDNIKAAAEIIKNKIEPITDVRATAEYRREVSGNIFMRAMYDSLGQFGISM